MEIFGLLAIFFLVKFLYGIWKTGKEERERLSALDHSNANLYTEAKDELEKDMENNIGIRNLFMETLTKIGCQYELSEEEDDSRIFFAYQGEHFFADAKDEFRYVSLWDTHWGHIELYDVDAFSRLKKAINSSNLNNSVTTVYTVDEDGKNIDVHCKSIILFIPQIPDLENYLRLELNEFFRAHQYVNNEMAKLREQEENVKP